MSDLKPCPFCGANPTIRIFKGKDGWRDRYAVLCRYDEDGCGAESGLYHYEAEAIEAWNKRTPQERKGKWIPITFSEMTGYNPELSGDDPVYGHRCSVCNKECIVDDSGSDVLSNFCPNCGYKMERTDDCDR